MQAAWKIHAPRKVMKGRAGASYRWLLLFRVQEQDCEVCSRDFFLAQPRAPAKCMDSKRENGGGRGVRVLYRVSKENRRRCNGVAVRAISFFFFARLKEELYRSCALSPLKFGADGIYRCQPAYGYCRCRFPKRMVIGKVTSPRGTPLCATKRRYMVE